MSNFRRLVEALVDPLEAKYKNETFCCEIDEYDISTRDDAIHFIKYCKNYCGEDPAEMGEEEFFKDTIFGCDGYWGFVPVRLMTTDFILSVLEDCPHSASLLPTKFKTDNPAVLNYIKNNMWNNRSFKYAYDWLIERGLIQ